MNWLPLNNKILKDLPNDSQSDNGSYLIRTKHNQLSQVKVIGGKAYHHFDYAKHYPITDKQMIAWTHILRVIPPKE